MANKINSLTEIEKVLMDQIEKLNDDSLFESKEAAQVVVERSKAISSLANNVVQINSLKLEAVKVLSDNGGMYESYLGIEVKK